MSRRRLLRLGHQRQREVSVRVGREDLLACAWPAGRQRRHARAEPPFVIHWIVPPVVVGSGGHYNIIRFIRFLESRGHTNHFYLYDPNGFQSPSTFETILRTHFPTVRSEVRSGTEGLEECQAVFATSWETAYPVFNLKTQAKKFYFVQDFEPAFHPAGSEFALAENTYRFGFHGIAAGAWLSHLLTTSYDMVCDHYEFGSEPETYVYENAIAREKVLFYARPTTPRRGFELGVFALELFSRVHPGFQIALVGGDTTLHKFPFPVQRHGTLERVNLNRLYNECAAGLVLSLTNMSLLPLELMASGCIPVVNEGPNNRLVADSPYVKYAEASPAALAQAMHEVVTTPDLPQYAEAAARSAREHRWEQAGAKVEEILISELARGS